jgi:hypothetical protein
MGAHARHANLLQLAKRQPATIPQLADVDADFEDLLVVNGSLLPRSTRTAARPMRFSGPEVFSRLRKPGLDIPTLIMTGYVLKPADPRVVLAMIERVNLAAA